MNLKASVLKSNLYLRFLLWIKDNDEIIELLMTEAEPISNLLPPIMHPKLPTVELRSSTPNRLESSTPLLTRRLTKPAKVASYLD